MPTDTEAELHCDEQTLLTVRRVLGSYVCGNQAITNCINDLQNAGILFRERIPTWKEVSEDASD